MQHFKLKLLSVLLCLISLSGLCFADTEPLKFPFMVEKDGHLFNGTASFKFAIVSEMITLWSNDGSSVNGKEPVSSVEQEVKDGVFTITLGVPPMKPFYPELLDRFSGAVLRTWIDSGNGFKQLPDQSLPHNAVDTVETDAILQIKRAGDVSKSGKPDKKTQMTASLARDPKVIESKIARKKSKTKTMEEPKNPEGLARERYLKRAGKDGKIPIDALIKAKEHIDRMRKRLPEDAGLWTWEWLGPGNIGGRIRTILIHPTNPDKMWIGSVSGGIWTTNNAGASWSLVNDFMANLNITSLVMDPTNTNIMYAGTGEGFFGTQYLPGAGIFKSTDGGVTWAQLPSTNNDAFKWVTRLAHHPTQPNRIFAVTRDYESGTANRVMQSIDGGTTWTGRVESIGLTDIKIHPTATNRILVGGDRSCTCEPCTGACRVSGGVIYSPDGGVTWSNETTGAADKLPSDGGRSEVAFSPSNPDVMYVSMDRNRGEIWRTTDGGVKWARLHTGANYLETQGNYDNAIWVDPTDSNFFVVGGIDLWKGTVSDGWTTLTQISSWPSYSIGISAHADQHAIVHHPGFNGTTNKKVYFGNDGGIQMTNDIRTVSQLSGWVNLAHNLGITQFYAGSAAPDGSIILGGSQDNGTLRYRPSQGWDQVIGGDGGFSAVNYNNVSVMFGEYVWLEIYKSTTGGDIDSFSPAINGLTDAGSVLNALFIAPFVMDPNNPSVLVAGGKSIWKTTNSAGQWSSIRGPVGGLCVTAMGCTQDSDCPQSQGPLVCGPSGLCENPSPIDCQQSSDCPQYQMCNPPVFILYCSAIDIAKGNSDIIWVSYTDKTTPGSNLNGYVAKTTNGGAAWTRVDINPTALPDRWVTDIAINPFNSNEVFVTFGGYNADNVWYTQDGGMNWTQRTGTAPYDLPALTVNTVTFHKSNPDWVYIGTDLGVFASEDRGLNWSVTPRYSNNEGPANVEVLELFWQGGEHLIAATYGRGMFRSRPLDVIFVDAGALPGGDGSSAKPYRTITEAVNAAGHGTTISIKGATYTEAPLTLFKRGKIIVTNGPVIVN